MKIIELVFKWFIFYYFIVLLKKIISVTLTESEECAKQIGIVSITKQRIINFFGHIINVIKEKMHHNLSKKLLGVDGILDDNGYISCKIDESEIIGNQNVIYWMFEIVEGSTKEARVFCVLNNRTK